MSKRAEERALEAYPVKQMYSIYYNKYEDVNIAERVAFQKGYEQAEKDFLKKACEWLRFHASDYTWFDEITGDCGMNFDFIGDFRKVMQNEV